MATRRLLIDVHSHVYLPRYVSFLRERSSVPRIFSRISSEGKPEDRLLILDNEPSGGRPVGPQYWDRNEKLAFMDKHDIDVSIISSANPWLDFLPAAEALSLAKELNENLEEFCSGAPTVASSTSLKRLFGFGLLPLVPSISISEVVEIVKQISHQKHLRGVIMGTRGVGNGLDDEALDPVWQAIEEAGLVVFLHPHYGVDGKAWGEKDNGHVLPLALGFPFETTVATTRLILSGVFDRYPSLRLLLAHSGGALPALSSRLASCIDHDPVVASRLQHDARYYIGKLYLDAVAYGSEELAFASDVIGRATKFDKPGSSASVSSGSGNSQKAIGSSQMLFGTDHPFFPPLNSSKKWRSVEENLKAIDGVEGWGEEEKAGVRGENTIRIFNL